MIRWIVGSSLKSRFVVIAIAAAIMVFGFTQLENTPVDVLPEFSQPYVEIQTEALGLSAQEVEAMITTPLEADMLNGTPWVEEIRSQREKLLADRMRRELYMSMISTGIDSAQLTAKYLAVTDELINKLRAETDIEIDLDNLMAVNTTDEGLSRKIDFVAIRTQ